MKISLIVPVYNEEEAIPIFYTTVRSYLPLAEYTVEIVFINDGSTDATESIINKLAEYDEDVQAISFTRNFGKESALCAGLDYCTGEAVIPMDVDLQDPVEVIPQLLERWQNGADVVLAKRKDRSSDSFFKRKSAEWFYRLHNAISRPHIEENVGDFRLMSREVVENIRLLKERNVFMKGLLSWVGGCHVEIVEYTRPERKAGKSKFNGWKLWNLALEGITSFSTVPLRVWSYLGGSLAGMAFLYGVWIVLKKLIWGNDVPGYSSLIVAILILGGVQLIGIGVLGEYIGRIYTETKARPRYIVKKER
jgi:glycosyltransferase involved in cell wall biosynthesis